MITLQQLEDLRDKARDMYGHPYMQSHLSGYLDAINDVEDILEEE